MNDRIDAEPRSIASVIQVRSSSASDTLTTVGAPGGKAASLM